MVTSIASQLQAIKSAVRGSDDPIRRPLTRPSIIFDPKEAADIDLRTILPLALSGLEVLIDLDERFRRYRETLFSQRSLDLDREKMVPKEEEKLNRSICSYLHLLAGHLQLTAALKTLEYLIRRYQVHVFNTDELVLCALPYHDTPAFVRIVQLLELGNKKWAFLEGVKASGAPPPRRVIVQQCIRDKGILEDLCNYAAPTKEFQHSSTVVCFCTAVIVEALGAIPRLETDTVKRVLNFVFDGLNPAMKGGPDHKAGALVVVGLLATRATLTKKLVQNLMFFIARLAEHDAERSADLPWLRVIAMAMISLVQSQSAEMIPMKTLIVLKKIRDFTGLLSGLSREFNIQKFLRLYLEALIDCSITDEACLLILVEAIETLPLKELVEGIVSKVLAYCLKLSQSMGKSNLQDAGTWAKKILIMIDKNYPSILRESVRKFLESSVMNSRKGESVFHTFCMMFEGSLDMAVEISDSKIWFSLEHPKAVVRQAALLGLSTSGSLKDMVANPQKLVNVRDAILRRLHDDDLSVVSASLSVDGLSGIISPLCLLNAYRDILLRCIAMLNTSTTKASQASDAAASCLEHMVLKFHPEHLDYSKEVATIIFPLLLVLPKTWRINLKALKLVKQVRWPFYSDSSISYDPTSFEKIKSLESGYITSVNMKTIGAFAESFRIKPQENMQWLIESSSASELSKSLFFLIVLQALMTQNEESSFFVRLYHACFPALKHEWNVLESQGNTTFAQEFNVEKCEKSCNGFVDELWGADFGSLNVKILICIFWRLLRAYAETSVQSNSVDDSEQILMLDDLFLHFATSRSQSAFKKHIHFLITNCCSAPFPFLSRYFAGEGFSVEVQVESLHSFASICSTFMSPDGSSRDENRHLQLLLGFPSLLISLANENQDVRTAAISSIEGLYKLWRNFDMNRLKNGNDTLLSRSISPPFFGDFLESIILQKKLIISDVNFLPSYLSSMLQPSGHSLLVSENIHKRFDQHAKDAILRFILSSALQYSSYGKLEIFSLVKSVGNVILHVEGIESLLFELLKRRHLYVSGLAKLDQKLSTVEVETLCLLLEVCVSSLSSGHHDAKVFDCLMKALKVDGLSSEDPAVVRPCVTVMQNLTSASYSSLKTEIQEEIFDNLVFLYRSDNGDIRNAARETLMRINIGCSSIARLLELILSEDLSTCSVKRPKRKALLGRHTFGLCANPSNSVETRFCILQSLLDVIILKKDIEKRNFMVQPLFHVLEKLFSQDWLQNLIGQDNSRSGALSEVSESVMGGLYYAQQTTLLILKDIADLFLLDNSPKDGIYNMSNINLLVECARSAKDVMSRNHVFLLLSSIANLSAELLSEHIVDIFTVVGESAVKQSDSHSQHVLENLISTLVPCWLSRTESMEKLLEIFVDALPDIAEHRRVTLIIHLLRVLGENRSLGVLVLQLFKRLIVRMRMSSGFERDMHEFLSTSDYLEEWEYVFALQICDQYSSAIWFPCLVKLLQEVRTHSKGREQFLELYLSLHFILHKLRDTELVFELESGKDKDHLQSTLGALMEQVILHFQLLSNQSKQVSISANVIRKLDECSGQLVKSITRWMVPSSYFKVITQLLAHPDGNVKRKTLGLLCESTRDHFLFQKKHKEIKHPKQKPSIVPEMDESTRASFSEMCLTIDQLIDVSDEDSQLHLKLAAISSVEVLTKEFRSETSTLAACLTCIVKHIGSTNLTVSSACLRTTGCLITALGSIALYQLPQVMKYTLERAHDVSPCLIGRSNNDLSKRSGGLSTSDVSLLFSVLTILEAVLENLGGFLNPYLDDILDLVVLHPEYASVVDPKMKPKVTSVRKLLTEKVPVRLLLTPLLKIYPSAVKCGESSLSLTFDLLASLIGLMDRPSVVSFHIKIFSQCLLALDLRRQLPETVKSINIVEESVVHALIVLTLKLTETMFRPLFLQTLEWAESEVEGSELTKSKSLDRAISFYKVVNKLVENHRSLFVPYFKYLLEGCTQYLTEDQDVEHNTVTKKRKKTKVVDIDNKMKAKFVLSQKQWHLRALIVQSLYTCVLYDTMGLKSLNSSNFQVLLKAIVSQFLLEPPAFQEHHVDLPSVEEVDESLVLCLGQMAVAAHSDVLWKPLNHEVLMQTRSEKVRPKILGLRVIKYLVEHLKEEYLAFLPETIPFLGELLEDVELPVKSLAQEILREMETLSGESLRQYL